MTVDNVLELTPEQEFFARVQFQNLVHRSNGKRYQDLFESVMIRRDPRFRVVKPQGRIGDQGNDGYIAGEGRYFQVFAPENPAEKVADAAKKAKDDFGKLLRHWDDTASVVDYRFVFNDKYQGAYPEIEHALADLKSDHDLESAQTFLAHDLEREFMQLSASDKQAVLGAVIPRAEYIDDIDYAALTEILQHLVDNQVSVTASTLGPVPEFSEKIAFNNIGRAESLLVVGNYQNAAVDQFFDRHGEFAKSDIRDRLAHTYEAARDALVDDGDSDSTIGDRLFFWILETIAPESVKQVQDAAIVLISYFFEKCDVFEEPGK